MHILPKINSPEDVKRLKTGCLAPLAEEIRQLIIETTANNGGHLASNLGMVETTIALHRVFSCPDDAFVFDVSHQAYAHKLLTGRYDRFATLRQAGGLSGFTNREESSYDTVTAGHSGSAISTAIGLAEANRLNGRDSWVIAVVGDGSFTNGMAYEAINQLASRDLKLIIVLNDNQMSISKNVGGLSKYLAYIRISEGYFNFKYYTKKAMEKLPLVGERMIDASRVTRDTLKRVTNSETWFESFGLEYIGVANGNNIAQMITVLTEAKNKNCPVIVHVKTKKGLGYAPSEEHPECYHSVGRFSLDGQTEKTEQASTTFTDVVGRELVAAAERDERLCAITAAMTDGCGLAEFAERFRERFFDVGIAEEHEITMAGGLSIGGMKPVAVMYSTFAQRVFDQLWHDIALQKTKAILMLSHCGIVPGDGVTHQGIYDVSLFSCLHGVKIYSPDTFEEWRRAFEAAQLDDALSIIRYPKGTEAAYPAEVQWQCGENSLYKTCVMGDERGGKKVLLLTYGRIAENVVKAAAEIAEGHDVTVKTAVLERIYPLPIDEALVRAINEAEHLIFFEEHVRAGAIGEKFAAAIAGNTAGLKPKKLTIAAINKPEIPHGDFGYLIRLCGLDTDAIKKKILDEIK